MRKITKVLLLIFGMYVDSVGAACPTEYICTEGIMGKNGKCYSCNVEWDVETCDIQQAIKNCPNRVIDEDFLKLKCSEGYVAVDHRCLVDCQAYGGVRAKDGISCVFPNNKLVIMRGRTIELHGITASPFLIHDDNDAKDFICNDGIMDRNGFCYPCNSPQEIYVYSKEKTIKACPNRFFDNCGYSKLKCDDNEDIVRNLCLKKCEPGYIRQENNQCFNPITNKWGLIEGCPMYL